MEYLIPEEWFVQRHTAVLVALTIVFFATLIKGADWLIEGAAGLAYRLGLPKVIVGATIVSLGTTSPEAAVSVMAAWGGNAGLALGNAVGSIICDTGMIFGLCCMLTTLPADRFVLTRQGWVQFGGGVLLAGVCYATYWIKGDAATLGHQVGVVFLAGLVLYMWISVRWSREHAEGELLALPLDAPEADGVIVSQPSQRGSTLVLATLVVVGLVLVIVSSHVVVNSVVQLAARWGVPEVVIAATLVAAGTSLPELAVGISSIRKGHAELLVGNVIGADILNVLFVVGASAAAAELPLVDRKPDAPAPYIFLALQIPTMLIILAVFRIFIVPACRRGAFSRWNGVPLFLAYVAFVILSVVFGHGYN